MEFRTDEMAIGSNTKKRNHDDSRTFALLLHRTRICLAHSSDGGDAFDIDTRCGQRHAVSYSELFTVDGI